MARKILRPAKKQSLLIRNEALLQQKREAVVEAAFALFLKEGFHRTTTRDIARRAERFYNEQLAACRRA